MKKVLFISLLLVAVFLIGSSGVAADGCIDYQDYTCKATVYQEGKIMGFFTSCVELCYDDPFAVGIEGPSFEGTLYPALDDDGLLGTFSEITWGVGGCSVDFSSRRAIRVRFSFIQNGEGVVDIFNCTPCNNCCHDDEV